jgi:hypothetical protein
VYFRSGEVDGVYFQACNLAAPESCTGGDVNDSGVAARHIFRKYVNLLVSRNVVRMVRNLGEGDSDARGYPDYPIGNRRREQGINIFPDNGRCRRGEYFRPIFDPRAQVHGADADHLKTAERQRVNVQAKGALKPLGSRVAVQQVFAPCCAVLPDLELTSFHVQRSSSVEFPFGFCCERSRACLRVGTVALGEVLFRCTPFSSRHRTCHRSPLP